MRLRQHVAGSGREECACDHGDASPALVVVTGGPGAGKTALLKLARQRYCRHVYVLEEAAGIVFGGGFPREDWQAARQAAQRAIYRVQVELERLAAARPRAAVILCDRGTIDGAAYWPGSPGEFFTEFGVSHEEQLARYAGVLHLRTPPPAHYTRSNALRIETAEEARRIDDAIFDLWSSHPEHHAVNSSDDFLVKARDALTWLDGRVPACCRAHAGLSG